MSAKKEKTAKEGGLHSSLVAKLRSRLSAQLFGIYLVMDLLLLALCGGGIFLWADSQSTAVSALVALRGVPTAEATVWMAAGDYTVAALPPDAPSAGFALWLPFPSDAMPGATRSFTPPAETMLFGLWGAHPGRGAAYTVTFPQAPVPYRISIDLEAQVTLVVFAARLLLICQLVSLILNFFKNTGLIRSILRPISDLAAAATKLGRSSDMSPRELARLAAKLGEINATHLDTRIPVGGTQRELQTIAQAINAMLDRVSAAYASQLRFVSDASHELRTPIAVIQGYANLLDRWGKNDPVAQQEAIDAIRSEADAMKALVEQLLFLARGDNDSMAIHMTQFDLSEVASQALKEAEMIDQTHTFSAKWDGPVVVTADMGLLKQALRVLIDNSAKYSPAGTRITVSLRAHSGLARISVQDEGQGIGPDALPHIFDRFYRTDESRARQTGGTGLGLAIAQWIVVRHAGWFEVLSRTGIGTRMTMVLPILTELDSSCDA